jgi:2-polyprenyl-6-methoxyphenol hydroxylase-like FAD-dependent oxidoreductase
MVPQPITEAVLLQRLREFGTDVYRPWQLKDLRQDSGGAVVTLTAADGTETTARGRYVVGADGMHSTVRERAGIGFTGDKYEQSFVLADLHMEWPLSREEVMLFFSPEGLVVVAPLPGGSFRIVATVDDAPEHPTMSDVQQLLKTRGPGNGGARVQDIIWSSRFRVHHRIADHYRAGRILVAGDAAHVHSPAGGQGMNTGIQDAAALGHTLAAILDGHADESQLDVYEHRRRPVAQRVVAFTDRMTKAATLRGSASRRMRNTMLGVLGHVPPVTRFLATELAGLRNRETPQGASRR